MERWLGKVVRRIHFLAKAGHVVFTAKADHELDDLKLGIDLDDAVDVIQELTSEDFDHRIRSTKRRDWMYVFKPEVFDRTLYVKLVLREACVVVSFHEDSNE